MVTSRQNLANSASVIKVTVREKSHSGGTPAGEQACDESGYVASVNITGQFLTTSKGSLLYSRISSEQMFSLNIHFTLRKWF